MSTPSIGHIHLKVSDLERAVKFYTEVIGFDISTRLGTQAAFLAFGGYHHHLGLNTWESQGGSAPLPNHTGLYHFAILMPDRRAFARAVKRLAEHHWPLQGAADHGVSEAVYLSDPDGNGIEIYVDRPKAEWPKNADGTLAMYTRPLDVKALLQQA